MTKKLKLSALASLGAAFICTAQADTTNLLQAVGVAFTVFTQGTPVVTSTGTNNVVNHFFLGSKDLIRAVSAASNFTPGDVLVRATPVTNAVVLATNLDPVGTNTLVLTNTSTDTLILSNELIFNGGTPIVISNLQVTFSTNTEVIGTNTVTLGTNTATAGTNTIVVGTNTTVAASDLTNAVGLITGTNYVFTSTTLNPIPTTTNILGTATWQIYNPRNHGSLVAISTNVLFDIRTRHVFDDGTNLARIHGETVTRNNVIKYGTTDEIRLFVLSNSSWNIRLQGYAHGRFVPVSLGGSDVASSQDFNWEGDGSGLLTNTPVVIDGDVSELYFKFLK